MNVIPRPRGDAAVPRLVSCTLDPSAPTTMSLRDPLASRTTLCSPSATPVRAIIRLPLALKELDFNDGVTGPIFAAIIGVMQMVPVEGPQVTHRGITSSVIALRIAVGRMGLTFARSVAAVAPTGPATLSAPVAVAVRTLVTLVATPTPCPVTR